MKLSACMIVKNEEKVLEKTLLTLSQGVDEIILVDTGSNDRTVEIAKKFGAKVFHFTWIDDFAAARNESLMHANGEWIIWVDADEFVGAEDFRALRKVLEESQEDAYYLPIFECKYGERQGSNFYFRLKVFRNRKGFHFERAFNEQVYASSGKLLETAAFLPNLKIAHWGRDLGAEKLKTKKERNFRILKEVMEKHPSDPFYHFLLANNCLEVGDKEMALSEFGKVVELAPNGPLAATARIRKAKILVDREKHDEAYADLKEAVKVEPWNAEAYNLIGVIYLSIGNVEKAIQVLEHSSKLKAPKGSLMGFDATQYTYFPHYLLGNAYLLKNQKEKALEEFRLAYRFQLEPGLKHKIDKLEKEVGVNG